MEQPRESFSIVEFPPLMLVLVLVVTAMLGSLLGSGLAYLIALSQGQDLVGLMESIREGMPLETRNTLRLVNLASHLMTFTFPVVVVAILFYRRDWLRFLRLDRQPASALLLAGCFFMLAVFPLAQFTYWLNQQIPLPEWAGEMENKASGMLKGLIVMDSPWEFLLNLLVMAVLPAVGEELMFRGVIQQKVEQQTRRPHLAIWLTAVIFSAVHFQFEGFLARMLLGAALGYLFYWTRNLWIPIAAHFLTNGLQVAFQYFYGSEIADMQAQAEEMQGAPWPSLVIGGLFIFLTGRYLHQHHLANKHP